MLVSIPPKMSNSVIMGYYIDAVSKDKKAIKEYVTNQSKRNKE